MERVTLFYKLVERMNAIFRAISSNVMLTQVSMDAFGLIHHLVNDDEWSRLFTRYHELDMWFRENGTNSESVSSSDETFSPDTSDFSVHGEGSSDSGSDS
jgi:hypothetical protein